MMNNQYLFTLSLALILLSQFLSLVKERQKKNYQSYEIEDFNGEC